MITPRVVAALSCLAIGVGGLLSVAPPASADGPGVGSPWVVTLGDSYISGEAGRWAGSSNSSSSRADALGGTAYFDNAAGTGETIARCHRSKSAEAYVGGGVNGLNLACSGATTATSNGTNFKPGLDFYDDGAGHLGQAKLLQQFATTHRVGMVTVSIGGNDFKFADVVQSCVVDFLTSPTWLKDYCYDDKSVKANFTSANVAAVRARITTALRNVSTAMRSAGYDDSQWTLLVQNYPSPIPRGSGIRYSESGYSRQSTGGCGFWNRDADWANDTALPTINSAVAGAVTDSGLPNVRTLDLSAAFNGRRLCENTVGLYEEKGIANCRRRARSTRPSGSTRSARSPPAAARAARTTSRSRCTRTTGPSSRPQLRPQAWNAGNPRSGSCRIAGSGLVNGEPVMSLS